MIKNNTESDDNKSVSSSYHNASVYMNILIFIVVVIFLTLLFYISVKKIIEQFVNAHCPHTFVIMIIIVGVLSAGYIITMLCVRKHYLCMMNMYRLYIKSEIDRINQTNQASTNDHYKGSKDVSSQSPNSQVDKNSQSIAKCNDCNKHDDVNVQIALGIQNSIDVQTNKQ